MVRAFEDIISGPNPKLRNFNDIVEKPKVRSFDEIVGSPPVRLTDLADQWLRPESVGLLPGPEPPSIEDYFVKPETGPAIKKKPIPFIPPFGGIYAAPKKDYLAEAGLPEIGKAIREMVAPTTAYTEKEAREAFRQIPRAFENIGVRILTLGGLAGPLMGLKPSQLRAAIDEDAREGITSGLAPALAPATADTAILAVQWGYIYPKLFAAAGATGKAISKIPQVAKGMKALKAMGGIDKIATKYPRLYNTATNAISSFAKGATVGGVTALPEALGEELPAGEVIRHVGKSAAILGGVAMTFSLASEVDTRTWTNKFRKTLLEAHNKQFDKAIAGIDAQKRQYMAMPDIPEYRAAKAQGLRYIKETTNSLGAEKIRQLKAIDGRVATAEAQLRSMKSGKLYKKGQELIEKPDAAARRNIESLKIGLGKSKPFIEMPTTRAGEAVETVKGVAGAIRHPVKTIGEATRPTRPPVYEPPTIPPTGVVTPPPVVPPVQVPQAVTPTPAEIKMGALPGMGAEVRETTYKEIIGRFPEYEGFKADELLSDKLVQQWPALRDEFDQIIDRQRQLGKKPEDSGMRPEQFAWEQATGAIETRIDELSELIKEMQTAPKPQRLEDVEKAAKGVEDEFVSQLEKTGEYTFPDGRKFKLEETKFGWVVKETEGKFTTTKGGGGPNRWSKAEAIKKAVEDAATGVIKGPTPAPKEAEEKGGRPSYPMKDTSIEAKLFDALHGFAEAKGRWDSRRKRGMTDEELKLAISEEFGISGGSSMHGGHSQSGGKNPRFWDVNVPLQKKPTLQGKALINKVRDLMKIPAAEKPVTPEKPKGDIGTIDKINVVGLSRALEEKLIGMILGEKRPLTNTDIKNLVAELYGVKPSELTLEKGYSHKKVQEAVEAALVRYARQVIQTGRKKGRSEKAIYEQLQILYEQQPVLVSRTGKTIARQAYSTPVPLAYVTSLLAGIDENTTVFEPTAGTGMLTIGADTKNVVVNEIDPARSDLLAAQGFSKVIAVDATKPTAEKDYDVVIMNPPFGKYKEEVAIDKYKLTKIEHIIAAQNLKAMADDGRAVMIIAAPKIKGPYSTPDWIFGNFLYSNYNVVGDFEVSGDLYKRQGAAWPVRIIVINGRQKSEKSPPRLAKVRANSWDEVYNMVGKIQEGELPEIELPEGWQLKEQQGQWQVFDNNNQLVGEIIQLEDGTFNVRAIEKGKPEEYGMPEEGKSFGNFADALKALSNIAQTKGVKIKGKKPGKTVRSKIHVVPTAARKKPGRPATAGGGAEEQPPTGELGPVRKPAEKPAEPAGERPGRGGRPGELPGERVPAGVRRPGEKPGERRPGPGGVAAGKQPVSREPAGEPGPPIPEQQRPEEQKPAPERGPERPRVPEAERRPKAPGAEERKPVGVVGLSVGKVQVPYKPFSRAPAENENIPTYLAPHVAAGLEKLLKEVGDIDDYVRDQLQFKSKEEMYEYLSATQIDTIALALDRLDKGSAFIIGHQTGVGKGRCAAAIVRRAILRREILRGHKPVFFTANKDLFTDFYRDLTDIGLKEDQLKPLMINADIDIKDQHNNIIFQKHGGRPKATAAIRKALKTGDYNIVLATYSQINTEGRQQRAQLAELAYQQILILDESHKAAGESNTGNFFRDTMIPHSSGVVFMSATYAKNPKTMMLYARTGLLEAFDGDVDKMLSAVAMGGEPYQEVIAAALARANAYIRTELDFSGVTYETIIDSEHRERDVERADKVTGVLRDIVAFDNMFSAEQIEPQKKQLKAIRKRTKSVGTTIGHTNFAAVAHNAIKQMLLALKIDETVEMAKRALKEGKRPFIGVENTMGSFLDRYVEDYGLKEGGKVEGFDYRAVLSNLLQNVLRYSETDAYGNKTTIKVPVEQLSLALQDEYHRIEKHIYQMVIELPGSPIDEIIGKLEAEGYKVGEITGRDKRLKKTGPNEYTMELRSVSDRDKTSIAYQYNNGDIEVLIGNVAAAEGMSIHASEKFKNRQKRQMIVAQPHADINKFVQMLGRVNRKGQVVSPEYKILMTSLPTEIRPAAVLEKKMRSLNANTSAKTKGMYQQKDVPDILNLYGDYLVAKYIVENPDILIQIGLDVDLPEYQSALGTGNYHGPWHNQNIAKRFTGRLALLKTGDQDEFYNWVEPEFNRLMDYLDKTDQNELVSIEKDYKADLVKSQIIFVGEPGNVFQEVATLDKMSIKMSGKPYTVDEMKQDVDDVIKKSGNNTAPEYRQAMQKKMDAAWVKYCLQQGEKKLKKSTEEAHERTIREMSHLVLGGARMDSEGNPMILLEIMDTFDKKKFNVNPAAPSNIHLRVAVPHPAKSVILSLSQWSGLKKHYGNIERHYNIPTEQREERYIANGNIIAAMGILVGDSGKSQKTIRPKVINYTMSDGTVRQGLLLPKGYSPSQDLPTEVNMIPEAAVAYLMDGAIGQRHLKIGEARIFKSSSSRCYMEVPKSKARGLKYYGDTGLVSLIGDFETHGNAMKAVFDAEHLPDALVYLRNKGNAIKSDDSDPDTAREYNNAHRDRPESDYPETEDYGMPEPRKPRKIALKREAEKPAKKPLSNRAIVKYLSLSFGVPIRGVATHRKKYPGWYSKRTRGIRMKHVNSLRVACHEIGHHIDIYFNNEAAKKMSHAWYGMGAELVRLGKSLYGKKRPKGGYKAEGYAEFIFGWLTGAIDLKKEAPRTLDFFEKNYLKDNAEIADILYTAKDLIDKWKEQGAVARFDASIGGKLKPDTIWRKRFSLWWQTKFTDVSAPLQRLLKENIPSRSIEAGVNDPGFLYAHFTQTEGARARTMVMNHTTDVWGRVTGISLKEALKPVSGRIKEFVRYIVAARALNLETREIHSGFDPEDSLYIFKQYDSPEFRKAAIEVTEWNHRMLDYLVEAGALEEEAALKMRELNPVYIPFMRLFAPGEIRTKSPGGVGRGMIKRGKGVYKIHGSDRPIDDPLELMIIQTRRFISIAHKSMVARALVNIEARFEGLAGMIERVPAPIKATTFDAKQLKGQLASLGIDVAPGDLDDAMFTVFANSPIYLGKEHIISVVINGRRSWYQVHSELYSILEDMDQFQLPKMLNLLFGKANRMMRLGATGLNASFGLVKNPTRDAMDTVVKAKYARGPVALAKGIVKDLSTTGMAKSLGFDENKAARRFIDIGGKISGFIGQDRTSIQHLKGEMLANTISGKAIHTVRHPVHAIREVFGVPETGLRIEEFERALKDWMGKHQPQGGEPPPDAIMYAFAMASDQTINYRRAGSYGRWLNSMIVFWNANSQDISKVYRVLKNNPKRTILWGVSTLTMGSLGIWWLNKDEEWYKELPPWEKANYIHIPVYKWGKYIPGAKRYEGKEEIDYIMRLPVPFLMGHIFMSMPTTIVDSLYQQDPKRMTEFMGEVFNANIKPLFEWPALIAPYLDIRMNRDWTDRPIVTEDLKGKLPEDQYKHYTTKFCKILGKAFNISPAKLEYAINAYSGGLYRRIGGTVEKLLGKSDRESVAADWPLIGTLFVKDPYAPKQSIEKFYERSDVLNRKYQSNKINIPELVERKSRNKARTELSSLWDKLQASKDVPGRRNIYTQIGSVIKQSKTPLTAEGIRELFKDMDIYKALDIYAKANKTEKDIAGDVIIEKLQNKFHQLAQPKAKAEDVDLMKEYMKKYHLTNKQAKQALLDRFVREKVKRMETVKKPQVDPLLKTFLDMGILQESLKK